MTFYHNSSTGATFNSCTAEDLPADRVPSGYIKIADPVYTLSDEQKGNGIRAVRNKLLRKEVDPLVCNPFRWQSLSEGKRAEWEGYRNLLLQVPQQSGFPDSITWPTLPS